MKRGIPSMGGTEIGEHLARAAAMLRHGRAVVEVGTWMGAGTAQIIRGLDPANPAAIHCYDRFTANLHEVELARRWGVTLEYGEDTLPLVRERLCPLWPRLVFHRVDVGQCRWTGGLIGLYVDDAGKTDREFLHKLRTFGPWWVPGQTVVFLMDLHFHKKRERSRHHHELLGQQRFVDRHPDVLVRLRDLGLNGAMFRYQRPFNFAALEAV